MLLVHERALRAPLLYLSYYFKLHRAEYYDRLTAIRNDGDWEGWMRFFLMGVSVTAEEATRTAEQIFELRERHRLDAMELGGANGLKLLAEMFQRPLTNIRRVADHLEVSYPTASRLVSKFEDAGLLREVTGRKRSRLFRYEPYLRLLDDHVTGDDSTAESTVVPG